MKRAGHAILSATVGLLVGTVVYALAYALIVMLDPKVEVPGGVGEWIMGFVVTLVDGPFWLLFGGILYVMPLVLFVFLVVALHTGPGTTSMERCTILGTGLWVTLFGTQLLFGANRSAVDVVLLGIALASGVACGMCRLRRRLSA